MNNGVLYVDGQPVTQINLSRSAGMGSARNQPQIFVSHQRRDLETAKRVAAAISRGGPACYLDDLDPLVDGDSPGLERYLREVIGNSEALLAVVSNYTVTSWWVPMEIGVALDRSKHIGTYLAEATDLPSYLWRWPVMDTARLASKWADDATRADPEAYYRVWRELTRLEKSVENITVR